jgi:peptidyl-prolyl cis-trans isomerase D
MQIIQSIREKGAAITVAVIVLCLIGFVLMDAKQGSSRLFGSSSSSVGKVNGEAIELTEFNKKMNQSEAQEEQRTGQRPTGTRINQMREQVWNQVVAEKIFLKEADKLGITFTAKELSAILLSNDQNNPFLQEQGMVGPCYRKIGYCQSTGSFEKHQKV